MEFPIKVTLNEVVLRDGLQLEKKIVSVEEKELLFSSLKKAGVKSFEFGSFVHPKRVPQMENSGAFHTKIKKDNDSTTLIALVPNLKGVERAQQFGVKQINYVFSASDTHNLQNVQKSTMQSVDELKGIHNYCATNEITLDTTIATTFGCPFEGDISKERILLLIQKLTDLDINTLTLADTTGMANPRQVFELLKDIRFAFPNQKLNLHFHNTRGMGLSNIIAGVNAGVTSFDTSLGGLGGCPFAPGATGNVCTEDVVHMLHGMGIQTNLDVDELIATSALLEEIVGHQNSSYLLKAGPSNKMYPVPVTNY